MGEPSPELAYVDDEQPVSGEAAQKRSTHRRLGLPAAAVPPRLGSDQPSSTTVRSPRTPG